MSGTNRRWIIEVPRQAGCLPALLADAHALKPRQHLVAKVRQLLEVVDERKSHAANPGPAQFSESVRDAVRIADHQQAAHAVSVMVALALKLLLANSRRRNLLFAQDTVHRRPAAVLNGGVVLTLLG